VVPRSEDLKLIIRVINFELVEPICPRYVNVTGGQTDRQTDGRRDGRHTIAIPRLHYEHRAVMKASTGPSAIKLAPASGRNLSVYTSVTSPVWSCSLCRSLRPSTAHAQQLVCECDCASSLLKADSKNQRKNKTKQRSMCALCMDIGHSRLWEISGLSPYSRLFCLLLLTVYVRVYF